MVARLVHSLHVLSPKLSQYATFMPPAPQTMLMRKGVTAPEEVAPNAITSVDAAGTEKKN